ncbi:hypothetical protein CBM2587_A40125 [Cupriavidus taiwanensis]|uniref:Uncharacterized protein n=1 Tax=Cupriavidus taiwanensis TaxID=164546 RepID=A0A375BUC1_9BURK|nr:hypothetical protein CBM2587_A40125 [Cupriavidus taiwanensis]
MYIQEYTCLGVDQGAFQTRKTEGVSRDPDPHPTHAFPRHRNPRPARQQADGQKLADRGAAAHADEQPRPRGGGEPEGAGGLRRHRPRRAQLGML